MRERGERKKKAWQRPTLPGDCSPSTIGAGGLNCRVRDGAGCTPAAYATKTTSCALRFAALKSLAWNNHIRKQALHNTRTASSPRYGFTHIWKSPRPLVWVSYTRCRVYTAHLSSVSSSRGLTRFHDEAPHLGTYFLLRCFQQLSLPESATERCRWHDNSHTGAPSIPVLSY